MTCIRDITTLSDPVLLEKVDKLRDLNISQDVPLPQLVVVGDQSSGKSSLLESLNGTPFPKGQSLCTRHATQITSRRAKDYRVNVRIIAGPHASEEHKKIVESFQMQIYSHSEFREQFVDILKKASEKMGLRPDISTEDGAVFSEDVLKIEVHGPNEDYLTIIDVPGIFRNTTQGTTKDDMKMVKDLVKRYIKDDRTIILAVLPSNVDIATQEILELAEDFDKSGKRTLGILTKPDLVLEPSAQAEVCNLVQGRRRPLNLGYFLIRNRGANSGSVEQSELDQIFHQQPWNDLPRDRVGIPALKDQLRSLLVDITRREFPKLSHEVGNKIRECKKELDSLGPPRQDEREQRSFLSNMATAFQDRARAALAADYNAYPGFDKADELRLITQVVNITDVFSADFQQNGHSRHFENPDPSASAPAADTPDDSDCERRPVVTPTDSLRELLITAKVDDLTPEEHDELGNLIPTPHKIPVPRDDFSAWINKVYFESRGLDLGTFNANLVSTAFTEQSRKWEEITKLYMSRVITSIHRFIAAALRSICAEEQARAQLWSAIIDSLLERYRKAMDQASLLVEIEKRKAPYTLNRQFAEALSKARARRIAELLRPKARKDGKQYWDEQFMVNLDDLVKAAESKSNVEQLQEDLHDILHAYYGLALDRFIDNIFQLPVDYYLLHGPSSPLKVFNQEWVISLEADQLRRIAGETSTAKRRRSKLLKKMEDLSTALGILKS